MVTIIAALGFSSAIKSPMKAVCLVTAVSLVVLAYKRAVKLSLEKQSAPLSKSALAAFPPIDLFAQILLLRAPLVFTQRLSPNPRVGVTEKFALQHCSTEDQFLSLMSELSIQQQHDLREIVIDSSCSPKTLPPELFKHCTNLQKIDFFCSIKLTELPPELFRGCINLVEVNFPECWFVETLPPRLFANCTNLQTVNFSNCWLLRQLPPTLFANCPNLHIVNLTGCSALKELPDTIFELPSGCLILISRCLSLSRLTRDKIHATAQAEGYRGPRFYSAEEELRRAQRNAQNLHRAAAGQAQPYRNGGAEDDEGIENE